VKDDIFTVYYPFTHFMRQNFEMVYINGIEQPSDVVQVLENLYDMGELPDTLKAFFNLQYWTDLNTDTQITA